MSGILGLIGDLFDLLFKLADLLFKLALVAALLLTNPTREALIEGYNEDVGFGAAGRGVGKAVSEFKERFLPESAPKRLNGFFCSLLVEDKGNGEGEVLALGIAGMVIPWRKVERFERIVDSNLNDFKAWWRKPGGPQPEGDDRTTLPAQ